MKEIKTAEEFLKINKKDKFILKNNIDFKNKPVEFLIEDFSGTLDGDGYTLSNITLSLNVINDSQKIALFPYLTNATIKNVNFKNVTFKINLKNYSPNVGIICADANYCIFENIKIKGNDKYPFVYDSNECSYKNIIFSGDIIENSYEDEIEGE